MTENVQLALIIAVALVVVIGVVVFVLRGKLRSGNISVNRDGVQVGGETHTPAEPPVTKITGTKIKGHENEVTARNGAQVENSDIDGDKNRLNSNG
ncbi:MAG: hypothetical protein ACL93V_14655 [Candidatus Electrothrix sp. YB6]